MKRTSRKTHPLALFFLAVLLAAGHPAEGQTEQRDAGALVLVDGAIPEYEEFRHLVEPYLKHFGVPYTVLDLAVTSSPPANEYALYVLGHGSLPLSAGQALDLALSDAFDRGAGLLSFDSTPEPGGWFDQHFPRATPYDLAPAADGSLEVIFPDSTASGGYITELHPTESECNSPEGCPFPTGVGSITLAPWAVTEGQLPDNVVTLAEIEDPATAQRLPLLAALDDRPSGAGRAVQWGSIDWIDLDSKGPVGGHKSHTGTLDDLVWRSLSWAAQKPFAMKLLPPLLTARIDHATGFGVKPPEPYTFDPYVDSFIRAGFKPFLSVMIGADGLSHIDCPEQWAFGYEEKVQLSKLARNGLVTASVHQLCKYAIELPDDTLEQHDYGFFHPSRYDHPSYDDLVLFSPAEMQARYAIEDDFHNGIPGNKIPRSSVVVPHRSEIGVYGFPGLAERNVKYLAISRDPIADSLPYQYKWPRHGPYREIPEPRVWNSPLYSLFYADDFEVSYEEDGGFSGSFFSCNSEMRGDPSGLDWNANCPEGCVEMEGIEYLRRALDSRVMASLFTHDARLRRNQEVDYRGQLPAQLETIVEAVEEVYDPWYMTYDDACEYIQAHHDLNIFNQNDSTGVRYNTVGAGGPSEGLIVLEDGQHGLRRLEFELAGQSNRSVMIEVFGENEEASSASIELPEISPEPATNTVRVFRAEDGSPVIDCSDDAHQNPPLAAETLFDELLFVDSHGFGVWQEFDWANRDFPIVVTEAAIDRTIDAPIEFSGRVANGHYRVLAALYHSPKSVLHYEYAYADDSGEPLTVTAESTSTGEFRELALAPITVTDGSFELEARTVAADSTSHAAWAYIRLVPQIDTWKDAHQRPGHPTTFVVSSLDTDDRYWDEFHWSQRAYPGLFANLGELSGESNAGDCTSPSELETMEVRKGVANGCYSVFANLYYGNADGFRYFYGYGDESSVNRRVHVTANAHAARLSESQADHKNFGEVALEDYLVTDGRFRLTTNCAQPLGSTPNNKNFGWSWIRLEPNQNPGACQ